MFEIKKESIGYENGILFKHERLIIHQHDRIVIFGKNGSGKSTFIKEIVHHLNNPSLKNKYSNNYYYVPQLPENVSSLSGGEKTKQALNHAFQKRDTLLLLDEPSANLDEETRKWLHDKIQQHLGPIIIVSHDEDILNDTNLLWVIKNHTLKVFHGNYQSYYNEQKKQEEAQESAYRQQSNQIKRLQSQVVKREQRAYRLKHGNGKKMTSSEKKAASRTSHDSLEKKMQSSAKALQHRIERIQKVNRPFHAKKVKFVDPNMQDYQKMTVLAAHNEKIQINGRLLIDHVNLTIKYGDRLWIRGRNGSGKTTLVKHLLQRQNRLISQKINVGYFNQELEQIDLKATIWKNAAANSLQTDQVVHAVLAGLDLKNFNQMAYQLSGGQRVRLQLAKVLLGDNQFLILDEPTNYLDLETKTALKSFLQNYPGAILLISHDHHFAESITDKFLLIKDHTLKSADHIQQYSSNIQGEKMKLKMQLDQLIANPDSTLEEITAIKKQIDKL